MPCCGAGCRGHDEQGSRAKVPPTLHIPLILPWATEHPRTSEPRIEKNAVHACELLHV